MNDIIAKIARHSFSAAHMPMKLAVRLAVACPPLRRMLNRLYLNLDDDERERFHAHYAKICRFRMLQNLMYDSSSQWTVQFCKRDILMPLNRESLWLDWDQAVSIVGHDIEVKKTYANLLSSNNPPQCFFDVGANYGTHSILFHSVGVPVIAFEPNPACFQFCKKVCELNNFPPLQWERVAIGNKHDQVELVYPERDTWLGSISREVAEKISETQEVIRETVPLRPLDDFIHHAIGKRLLIKIDVEGLESEVLHGAARILAEIRPEIIFESNNPSGRRELYDLFVSHNYRVYSLPWPAADGHCSPFTLEMFLQRKETNFMARPN